MSDAVDKESRTPGRLTIRLDMGTRAMLSELCQWWGADDSEAVRLSIRRQHRLEEIQGRARETRQIVQGKNRRARDTGQTRRLVPSRGKR